MEPRSNVVAKAAEQVHLMRAENKRNDRLLDRIEQLSFRLRELLTTAEACEELHQHYKILAGVKADTHEPAEFSLARAALHISQLTERAPINDDEDENGTEIE